MCNKAVNKLSTSFVYKTIIIRPLLSHYITIMLCQIQTINNNNIKIYINLITKIILINNA